MDASKSVEDFKRRVNSGAGKLPIKALLEAAIAFYAECPADGLTEEGGDALLFQYGAYDWGSGQHFEVDLTRQFIEVERDDEDNVISQFRVTCFFKPTNELIAIGSGDLWCWSKAGLPDFSEWIMAHPVITAVEHLSLLRTEIRWELI